MIFPDGAGRRLRRLGGCGTSRRCSRNRRETALNPAGRIFVVFAADRAAAMRKNWREPVPRYETPEPPSVALELSVGDVLIAASDRADTVVEVRPSDEANESDVKAAQQVRVGYANGTLRVTGPKAPAFDFSRKTRSVDVSIELPSGSPVSAEIQVGNFRAPGRLGSTQVSTGSGQVQLGTVEGTAVVKNSNGDTTIDAVTGDVRVRASNGNIRVERAGSDVHAKTSNGRIRLGEVVRGLVVLETATGDLEIGIAEGSEARLDVNTGFGRVRNRLEDATQPGEARTAVEVRGRTAHGDIIIHRS
jgi:Putative adhesin